MLTVLPEFAISLGTTDRTLRRAVAEGLIRGRRVSPRKFDMPLSERAYLYTNWPVLSELRDTLRTEPSVRAAVLFGSYARGEQHDGSDLDILVDRAPGAGLRAVGNRLTERLGSQVQLVALEDAEKAPLLLAEVLRDGRVLVDRNDTWPRLLSARPRIDRQAAHERRRVDAELEAVFGTAA
jgi:predicted nucleotidyltransferase